MDAVSSMIKKLRPLGLYNTERGTNIRCELEAYAEALDEHRSHIDEVLRECFIATARNYGIETRERVLGALKTNYTLTKRREMLTSRNTVNEKDFTLEALGRFINGLGVNEYDVTENPANNQIAVCVGGSYSDTEANIIKRQIENFLPAHLNPIVYFGGRTWHQFQQQDKTFAQLDADDLKWSQIHML